MKRSMSEPEAQVLLSKQRSVYAARADLERTDWYRRGAGLLPMTVGLPGVFLYESQILPALGVSRMGALFLMVLFGAVVMLSVELSILRRQLMALAHLVNAQNSGPSGPPG